MFGPNVKPAFHAEPPILSEIVSGPIGARIRGRAGVPSGARGEDQRAGVPFEREVDAVVHMPVIAAADLVRVVVSLPKKRLAPEPARAAHTRTRGHDGPSLLRTHLCVPDAAVRVEAAACGHVEVFKEAEVPAPGPRRECGARSAAVRLRGAPGKSQPGRFYALSCGCRRGMHAVQARTTFQTAPCRSRRP